MTQQVCTTLAEVEGVVNPYSWPTGMRNEGPTEYGIYFDQNKIAPSDLIEELKKAIQSHDVTKFHLETDIVPPYQPQRVNEGMDEKNASLTLLGARVIHNPVASHR